MQNNKRMRRDFSDGVYAEAVVVLLVASAVGFCSLLASACLAASLTGSK